jgi:hypothetical protein
LRTLTDEELADAWEHLISAPWGAGIPFALEPLRDEFERRKKLD